MKVVIKREGRRYVWRLVWEGTNEIRMEGEASSEARARGAAGHWLQQLSDNAKRRLAR